MVRSDPAARRGPRGALERPHRATGLSWWLDGALTGAEPDRPHPSIEAFQEELRESGPDSIQTVTRFALHLSPEDAAELDRRICAVLDEYVVSEDQRRDQPVYGGIVIVHRLAG